MWEMKFWKATTERAVRAAANALVGYLAVGMAANDWLLALQAAGIAALSSVVLSLVGSRFGPEGPSFGQEEVIPTPAPAPRVPPAKSAPGAPVDGPWRPEAGVPEQGGSE